VSEYNETRKTDTPIVIVGGGPVGMVLALKLSRLGVASTIVEFEHAPRWHPKGSTQNARTMEHYRSLGISHRIRTLGLPPDHSTDVGYFTRLTGWELARIAMLSEREKQDAVRRASPTDQIPEPLLRCNQMYVERFLFDHIKADPLITLKFGYRFLDWADKDQTIMAGVENVETGAVEKITAGYLVGCDGGQGTVRRKLGIRYSGEAPRSQAYLGGAMLSTHLRIPSFYGRLPHAPCWHYFVINAEMRSNLLTLNGKDEFLVNSQLRSPDDKPNDGEIIHKLQQSFGSALEVSVIGHWTWTAGLALVADHFGRGRVWLAGDAVHLFTPTGGFGMNTGVDDAANLAWKLAAMVQGWGGPGLLPSYEVERRPIALRNTGAAKALTHNVGDVPVGAEIESGSEAGNAARKQTGTFLASFKEEFASIGIQLGMRYDASPLIVGDGSCPPADDPFVYRPSACPGGRAPHFWFRDGSSLLDRLGSGFTILRFNGARKHCRPLEVAAKRRGVPLTCLDVDVPDARSLYERDLALIRPDHHVVWRGDTLPEDCDKLIAQAAGFAGTGHQSQ